MSLRVYIWSILSTVRVQRRWICFRNKQYGIPDHCPVLFFVYYWNRLSASCLSSTFYFTLWNKLKQVVFSFRIFCPKYSSLLHLSLIRYSNFPLTWQVSFDTWCIQVSVSYKFNAGFSTSIIFVFWDPLICFIRSFLIVSSSYIH